MLVFGMSSEFVSRLESFERRAQLMTWNLSYVNKEVLSQSDFHGAQKDILRQESLYNHLKTMFWCSLPSICERNSFPT